jgi:hypothetical protein
MINEISIVNPIKTACRKAAHLYLAITILGPASALAVDKVYHPYVQLYERELDYRVSAYRDGDHSRDFQTHRVSFGYGISEYVAVEAYLIGEKFAGDSLQVEAYELEVLWQMSDQGARWLDSAVIFEFEHADDGSYSELGTGLIVEKELGSRWSATANLIFSYEFGSGTPDELETSVAAQLRYRLGQSFEPAIEAYVEEDILAVGPAALGSIAAGARNRINWEAAVLLSAKHDIAKTILRASLEWEF